MAREQAERVWEDQFRLEFIAEKPDVAKIKNQLSLTSIFGSTKEKLNIDELKKNWATIIEDFYKYIGIAKEIYEKYIEPVMEDSTPHERTLAYAKVYQEARPRIISVR